MMRKCVNKHLQKEAVYYRANDYYTLSGMQNTERDWWSYWKSLSGVNNKIRSYSGTLSEDCDLGRARASSGTRNLPKAFSDNH